MSVASSSIKTNGIPEGASIDMETLKQEILREMRKEIGKMKQEIIDGKNKVACYW
jgi:vacuolar-type H+-ATPase subunit H